MTEAPLKVWLDRSGTLLRLRLNRPKANVLDAAMIAALDAALVRHRDVRGLKGVLLDAEGPHFSFGASVEEHMPDKCAAMMKDMHGAVLTIARFPAPVLVAIRGQCLGGGLEVAAAGHLIFAAPDAVLGQPEIRLGVFAPAASCLLPERIGRMAAEDLLISGRSIGADEAKAMGLIAALADDPEAAALAYFDKELAPKSASSLRYAVEAARQDFLVRLETRIAAVEKMYLDGLMSTRDAVEGLEAFLAKRPAKWEDR
jgi:cyclohexa-1,5-dienecarbonyl-CoA hydratase